MIAAAAPMADSGLCCAIPYAMDTLPASRSCHSGSRTKTRSRGPEGHLPFFQSFMSIFTRTKCGGSSCKPRAL